MAAKVKWPDDYNPWQESRSYLNHCSVPALALEEEEEVAACLQVESYSDQMAASRVDSSYSVSEENWWGPHQSGFHLVMDQ